MKKLGLALALGVMFLSAVETPVSAKIRSMAFDFNGSDFSFGAAPSSYSETAEIDGVEWAVKCGKGVTASEALPAYCAEGFDSAQRFLLPAGGSNSSSSYLILSTDALADMTIRKVEVYAWVHGSNAGNVRLSVNTANAADITKETLRLEDTTAVVQSDGSLEAYSAYRSPLCFVGEPAPEARLKLYFVNKSTAATSIAMSRVVVEYDDGIVDPIDLSFNINGESVESGCTVQPGAVLTLDYGDISDAVVTYLVGDSSADDVFPAEGIVLDTPGYYTYHFTVSAPGRDTVSADFEVNVADDGDSQDTVNFADYEKYGLTLYSPEDETTQNGMIEWEACGLKFTIPQGENVRMEMDADNTPMLMFAPGSYIELNVTEAGQKIVYVEAEGTNTEGFEYEVADYQTTEPESMVMKGIRNAAKWDSEEETVNALLLTNRGNVKAGLSRLRIMLDKDIETIIEKLATDVGETMEYYDLSGRRVREVTTGIYVERRGGESRLIIIKR